MKNKSINDLSLKEITFFFIIFNFIFKILFLNSNAAEYTDGIIQLTLFQNTNTLWPPLYTILVKGIDLIFNNEILSGRIVSFLSSIFIFIPLIYLANSLFGKNAAFLSALLYTISPLPLRWGVRLMTDSLFTLLFFTSLSFLVFSFIEIKNNLSTNTKKIALYSSLSIIFSVLTTLTHYRGVILFPLNILLFAIYINSSLKQKNPINKSVVITSIISILLWILIPAWLYSKGFGHIKQIFERQSTDSITTFFNYLNIFESFILLSPYFFTYTVFILFIFGIFRKAANNAEKHFFLLTFLYITFSILFMQSMVQSFLARYLLPILPLIIIYAGHGFNELIESKNIVRKSTFPLIIIGLIYTFIFSLSVQALQKGAFGDLKESAIYLKDLNDELPVFSNESYRDNLNCMKMKYWSKKDIHFISEINNPIYNGKEAYLVLHSAYGGSSNLGHFVGEIKKSESSSFQHVIEFRSDLVPLLTDIMEEPGTHQNPLAFVFRYNRQSFKTVIYKITLK